MKYQGNCDKHGMVSHKTSKDMVAIRGCYCPFCQGPLTNVIKEAPSKNAIFAKNKR
jgi:hypothetical protein